jgi:cold shock protein
MEKGTVKLFIESKGFGFITPDNGDKDLFVHFASINCTGFRTLTEGQRVSFDVTTGPKGLQACNIKAD